MKALKKPSLNSKKTERRSDDRKAPGFKGRKGQKLVEGLSKGDLVKKYSPNVKGIAQTISAKLPPNIDIDDLYSAGFIGLMDAADKYDSSRGYKFLTYATFRIRGAILDEIRSQDFVPRSAREKNRELEKVSLEIERSKGRKATSKEICDSLKISQNSLRELRELLGSLSMTSLEDSAEDGIKEEVYNSIAVNESTPHNQIEKHENLEIMKKIFSTLSDRETLVLSLYYLRGLNLKEIAKIMSLCESRISQHHRQAISKLKTKIRSGESMDDLRVEKLFSVLLSA